VELKTLAESAGISKNTLERAKSELGVQSVQQDGAWHWTLPESGGGDTQNHLRKTVGIWVCGYTVDLVFPKTGKVQYTILITVICPLSTKAQSLQL
jgi:hypothetical protein